jgi:Tol biopolymer transport system component
MTASGAGAARPVSWSPDSTQLVFASDEKLDGSDNPNNARNIWIVRADGSGLKPLTNGTASPALTHGFPAWSPDGTKILYLSDRKLDGTDALNTNITQNVWVVNPDGSSPTPLTQLTGSNLSIFSATWSPDGSKIAFVSARPLNGSNTDVPNSTAQNVWVMNADGSSPTPVTAYTAAQISVSDLAWTAGGTKLLFSSNAAVALGNALNTNSITNIFVIDVGGTGQTALTLYTATNTGANAPAQP